MQDEPSAHEIIAQVMTDLQNGIAPGFAQKVAANALGIALRELTIGQEYAALELNRLDKVASGPGSLEDTNRSLTERIRGEEDVDDKTIRHLILTTLEKIEVDQPKYPPLKAWLETK